MKKIVFSVALCLCGLLSVNAQQDLKKSVCVVKQNYSDAEKEAFEKTASTLFSNSYMSAARQLRKGKSSFGSGFLYKADDGKLYIITNKHVVRDAQNVQLVFKTEGEDKVMPNCKVLAKSDTTDIAIVEFPASETGFVPLSFNTNRVTDGTGVWTAGFPGLGNEPAWQLGNGVVSNASFRNLELTDNAHISVIQHTAQVDPGSSGGPLLVLQENVKTITKEVMVGKKKKTVTENVIEKEYKVVGMNTWKAYNRENANFSLLAHDVLNFVNNHNNTASLAKTENTEQLQNKVEKYMESINTSSADMVPFISTKMVTGLSESQLSTMLKNVSQKANNELRDGDAVEGLKMLVADNVKASIKKPAELKVNNVYVNGDKGNATFNYGKKQFNSTWENNYDGWQVTSTDMLTEKPEKVKGTVDSGFRILDLDGRNQFELSYLNPLSDPIKFEDEGWGTKKVYTDKFKVGLDYSHFFCRIAYWSTTLDYGFLNRKVTRSYDKKEETEETKLKYATFLTGVGVQLPMAYNHLYFAPDVKLQIGLRNGLGDFLEDDDNDMCFTTCMEGALKVGYMFTDDKILYVGGGYNKKNYFGSLSDSKLESLDYMIVKLGFIF